MSSTSTAPQIEFGGQSMTWRVKRILVRPPDESIQVEDPDLWHYPKTPNLSLAIKEHDEFCEMIKTAYPDAEIIKYSTSLPGKSDSIFVHDPMLLTDKGMIQLRMGKALRRGEESSIVDFCSKELHIPILGKLIEPACAEGGDIMWLTDKILAVGIGFRTNMEAVSQFQKLLPDITIIPVHLPYYQGKDACLHLQSLISLIDSKKAVVHKPLMPVSFVNYLEKDLGFTLFDTIESEFLTMATNILCLGPKILLTIAGNPKIQKELDALGYIVLTYSGENISLLMEGGATCLTRPILRQPVTPCSGGVCSILSS